MTLEGNTKTWIAVFGTLIGVIGIYVNFVDKGYDEPNLVLEIESMELIPTSIQRNFIDDLTRIEELYGAVTADKIHDLIAEIRQIDFNDEGELLDFNTQLQTTIKFFLKEFPTWTVEDIVYRNGVIIWPDGVDYDLLNDERVEMNFPDLINEVRAHPNSLDPTTILSLKKEAFHLYKPPGQDTFGDRKEVATSLRAIREAIQNLISRNTLKVSVKINILNKSNQPNFIKSKAMLRVHDRDSVIKDIPLSINSNALIPGQGFTSLMFESERLGVMDEETRQILEDNLGQRYHYSLFVEDSHDQIWFSRQGLTQLPQSNGNNQFIQKVNELFNGFFSE